MDKFLSQPSWQKVAVIEEEEFSNGSIPGVTLEDSEEVVATITSTSPTLTKLLE
jgi:hypothetical protein